MRSKIALAAALAAILVALPAVAKGAPQSRVVVGYFASWDIYGRNYHPKDIPAEGVSHLNYAFGVPAADGSCAPGDVWADFQRPYPAEESVDGVADDSANPDQHLFGNFNQLRKLKAEHPGLKLLISIGGWTGSVYFSDAAATPASRAAFAKSCIDTFIKGDLPTGGWPTQAGGPGSGAGVFDGIDLDWEYPGIDPGNGAHHSPADKHDATLLFQELRSQLDALGAQTGEHYLLTAALPAGSVNSVGSFELPEVAGPLDWVNLLTYDFHGQWDPWTNFNSPFALDPLDPTPPDLKPTWNTSGTVDLYLSHGVPADKLVVGVPFFAQQYIRVPAAGHGLYQPFDNAGLDPNVLDWDKTPTPTYHDLVDVARVVTPTDSQGNGAKGLEGYGRYWDDAAGEPWLYNPATQRLGETTGVFVSYDDPHSVAERVRLVRSQHLRGAMFWEVSQDDDAHDLVNALRPLIR